MRTAKAACAVRLLPGLEATFLATGTFDYRTDAERKTIERATLPEFEGFMLREYPDCDLEGEVLAAEAAIDRFQIYRTLLLPAGRRDAG